MMLTKLTFIIVEFSPMKIKSRERDLFGNHWLIHAVFSISHSFFSLSDTTQLCYTLAPRTSTRDIYLRFMGLIEQYW